MSQRRIIQLPDSVLRNRAAEIPLEAITSPEVQKLIRDMHDTLMHAPDGVGLAASQVGESLRLFLVSEEAEAIDRASAPEASEAPLRPEKHVWKSFVFINPRFEKQSRKKGELAEGCLSLPGKFGRIRRSEKVSLSWRDEHGIEHRRGFAKFFARVIQHEMDHLEGMLISDRAKQLFQVVDNNPKISSTHA